MSVLLVEVMADVFPCKLPPVYPFDKLLVVISETTLLPFAWQTEYLQVLTCEEFLSAKSNQKYFIRTSSELYRGAIAGHLNASCRFSVCSQRQDLYTRMFRNVQIYNDPLISRPTPTASISNGLVLHTPPAQAAEDNKDIEISLKVFKKCCNVFLEAFVGSLKNRALTKPAAITQIIGILNGKYAQFKPNVGNKLKTAELIFNGFIQADFFNLNGDSIIYNSTKCFTSQFPATLSMITPSSEIHSKPRAIKLSISVDDMTYRTACNFFLNNYLCSARLRSSQVTQVVNELERIIIQMKVLSFTVKDLAQLIFSSFCKSEYYKVSDGFVTYNLDLCHGRFLDTQTLPPPVFFSILETETSQSETHSQQRENKAEHKEEPLESPLSLHIFRMIEKVKKSKYLSTHKQIMDTIQHCLIEYIKEANLAFESTEIQAIVQATLEFLREQGYRIPN